MNIGDLLKGITSVGGWLFGGGGGSTNQSGSGQTSGTTTRQTELDSNQILSLIDTTLRRNNLGQIFTDQNAAGVYGGSSAGFLANDLLLQAVMQASIAGAKTTETTNQQTTTNQSSQTKAPGLLGSIGRRIGRLFRSDRRLKTDVQLVGKTSRGYNLYSYRFKDTGQFDIGVMADEVPASARVTIDGYEWVDYSKVM